MQGGSVFDDVAERVLKVDPNDIDAKYVDFFHEKIPSRQLAESTTTQVLDDLIRAQPQRLEFYRTRGIARMSHNDRAAASSESRTNRGRKKKKGNSGSRSNGQAPPNGMSVPDTPDVLQVMGASGGIFSRVLETPTTLTPGTFLREPRRLARAVRYRRGRQAQ
ncbi:hypothetical protein BDZ89DRAFT_1132903 [Hymenopellis radicata]|nr:hypothetical protein BDZ89DRAFT_1132903 [Hymenopellis radicata]